MRLVADQSGGVVLHTLKTRDDFNTAPGQQTVTVVQARRHKWTNVCKALSSTNRLTIHWSCRRLGQHGGNMTNTDLK